MSQPEPQAAQSQPGPPAAQSQKKLQPHRCNDRVEDFIQALYTLDFSGKVRPAWRNVRICLKSEIGHESREGYLCIKDPSLYLDPGKVYKSRG